MESLERLRQRKSELENELASITIKKHGSTSWAPGVQDQYKSASFSYDEYTDVSKAYRLKEQINRLDDQIKNYAQLARAERQREEAIIQSQVPKYDYTSVGKSQTTNNPAIAARYNAQQRLCGLNKVQQAIMAISGQKKKFKKLWLKAVTTNEKTQQQVADELNKMFR